jgi:ribosomal protein L32
MTVEKVRAAKVYRCSNCGAIIRPGKIHKKVTEKGKPVKRLCAGYCR